MIICSRLYGTELSISSGQPCFLKPGHSEPPLDYTPSLTDRHSGGRLNSKLHGPIKERPEGRSGSVALKNACFLTGELSGDGAVPHDASNAHNLIEGHTATVLDWKIKTGVK